MTPQLSLSRHQRTLPWRAPHRDPKHGQQLLCLRLLCHAVDVDLRADANLRQECGSRVLLLCSEIRRGENL